MRVALITSYPPKRCGIAQFSMELVDALRRSGTDVLVIGDEESNLADTSVNLGTRPGFEAAAKAIRTQGADVVHLQWEPGLFARRVRINLPRWLARQSPPAIISIHSLSTLLERSLRGRMSLALSKRAERNLVRGRRRLITVTTGRMAQLLEANYPGVSAEVVPLDLNSTRVPPATLPAGAHVLSFGFIDPCKQLETVVEMAQLRPDRKFVIAGAPAGPRGESYAQGLRDSAQGLATLEILAEWVPDAKPDQLISGALATILRSTGEYRASAAYTRSIASGVPVVAVRGSSVGEPVEATGSGLLSDDASGSSFARALSELEANYSRVRQGVQSAQNSYSWATVVARLQTLCQRAAQDIAA